MRTLKIIILSLFLLGCSSTKFIALPVINKPAIKIPPKPKLLSTQLTIKSTPMDVEKAHVTDIDALIVYSNQLTKLLREVSK